MFIKPSVAIPRILSFSSQRRPNISNIRENYFIRTNRNNNNSNNNNNRNISSNNCRSTSNDEEYQGPGCGLCGICRICTCITLDFVKTPVGILKTVELIFCMIIQNILSEYGHEFGEKLGIGFTTMSLINSSCFILTLVLVLCYSFSNDTYNRVRASLLEVVHSLVSALLYSVSSALLSRTVFIHLFHYYTKIPNFNAYPAMTGAYVIGYALAAVLAIDGILAYRLMKSSK